MQQLAADFGPGLSFGSVTGFAAGFALKKAGKVVVVVVGSIFCGLQGLVYLEFIEVHWEKIAAVFDEKVGSVDLNGVGVNARPSRLRSRPPAADISGCIRCCRSVPFGAQDGEVNGEDAKIALQQLQERLAYNMGPAGAGFATGFVLGLRYG